MNKATDKKLLAIVEGVSGARNAAAARKKRIQAADPVIVMEVLSPPKKKRKLSLPSTKLAE